MTLTPFSEDVLEKLVQVGREICLPISTDVTLCQYLIERGLATYEPITEQIKLSDEGVNLYQKLVQTVKEEIHFKKYSK